MKKLLFILIILIITSSALSAVEIFDPQLLTQIGVSAEQIETIQNIQYQSEQKIKMANAEINILKAQLEKLLLQEHPDMEQVKKTIEATLKWRIQSETANVEARVRIREQIGTKNWEKLLTLRKRILTQQRNQSSNGSNNQGSNNQGSQNSGGSGTSNERNSNSGN